MVHFLPLCHALYKHVHFSYGDYSSYSMGHYGIALSGLHVTKKTLDSASN